MKNLLLLEWRKLRWPVLFTLVLVTAAVVALTGTLYKNYSLEHDLEAWEVGIEFIVFLFPFIAVMPVCWLMYYERKDNFLLYTLPRVSKSRYLWSKWIAAASSSFLVMFIAMFLGVVYSLFIKPGIIPSYGLISPETGEVVPRLESQHFLGPLFVHQPLVYGLLLSFWQGILSALVATMGFVLSLFIQNIFVILTGPFIYVMLENYLLQIIGYMNHRLYISFNPEFYSVDKYGYFPLFVGPLLALLFMAFIALFYTKIKKVTVYPS
ncbi:ABC transporter permease [Paenibacillus sp. 1P07SE]|uniref:ABC transporter permease n=1 Tax=Paenibacillus sp. 1P07SE TaxID=3132209 RepID=UPI0039A654B1